MCPDHPIKGWKELVLDTQIPLASFIEFVELVASLFGINPFWDEF